MRFVTRPLLYLLAAFLLALLALPARAGGGSRTAAFGKGEQAGVIYLATSTDRFGNGKSDALIVARGDKSVLWALTWGSSLPDYAAAIARDSQGYLYVTGSTPFAVGTFNTQGGVIAPALQLGFILKISPNGSLAWAKTYNWSNHNLNFNDIAVDNRGNVYAGGSAYRHVDDTNDVSFSGAILLCCGPDGAPRWGAGWCTSDMGQSIKALDVDGQGNVIAVGQGNSGRTVQAMLLSFDPAGTPRWARYVNFGSDFDYATAVLCAPDGTAYVAVVMGAGRYPDPKAPELLTKMNSDAVLMSVDQGGNQDYLVRAGGPYDEVLETLALAPGGGVLAGGTCVTGFWDNPEIANADDIREGFLCYLYPRDQGLAAQLAGASLDGARATDQWVNGVGFDGRRTYFTGLFDTGPQDVQLSEAPVEVLGGEGWDSSPDGEFLTPRFSAYDASSGDYRAMVVDRDSAKLELNRQRLCCFEAEFEEEMANGSQP